MVEWASSDVKSLLALADSQERGITSASRSATIAKSTQYSRNVCNMKGCTGLTVRNPGLIIGRGGSNIRSLQKRTGTLMYQDSGKWFVFYDNDALLDAVKRSMSM